MKQILLSLSLLLLTLLPAQAVKKIQANPINVAISLVEKTDSAKVAKTLEYYGYKPQGKEGGFQIMKDANGNEIRFSFSENYPHDKYPTIIVNYNGTHKSLDNRLKELNFEKKGNSYERLKHKFSKNKTVCSFGPKSSLILRRLKTNQ